MKITTAQLAVLSLLLMLALSPSAAAQSAANTVTHIQLTPHGTTKIQTPAPGRNSGHLAIQLRNHPDADAAIPTSGTAQLPVPSPVPRPITGAGSHVTGFDGLNSIDSALVNLGFVSEPPDQGLTVGNGFVLEAINSAVALYDASSGALLAGPAQLNAFFNLDFAQFTSDPRTYFDTQTRRWFVTNLQIDIDPNTGNVTNHSHGLIAVSVSDNPLDGFSIFTFDTTDDGTNGTQNHAGCPCFGDQPLLGADSNGFYYTTNEFSITALTGGGPVFANGAQVYAMSKGELVAGLAPTIVHFGEIPQTPGHHAHSLQPAQSRFTGESDTETEGGVEFFVSHLNFNHTLDNHISVWAISNTRSLDEFSPDVELTKTVIKSEVYGDPPNATQKAGPIPFGASQTPPQPEGLLNTGDTRMQQVWFAGGLLWTGLSTVVQQGNNFVAGIAYFVIRPDFDDDRLHARIRKQGYISVANENVFYPAIAVNDDGRGVVGFTISGPDFFPSAAYSLIDEDRGAGKVHVLALGAFPDDGFTMYPPFSNGNGRWGDYSAAVIDEHGDAWFATEYIPPTLSGFPQGLGVNFGTFIGKIHFEDEPQD